MDQRRADQDVTATVRISDPVAVRDAVVELFSAQYPGFDRARLDHAFDTFTALYAGTLNGYLGCDTWYHDTQHSLDCTLAMARLIVGHDRSLPARRRLGADDACLGVICALFHDAGYIRREDEPHLKNGAELTLIHVDRSADFLARYLPLIGLAHRVAAARKLVHFTGYEIPLAQIRVRGYRNRMLGNLLGSADLIAQCADRCYLEKCYRYLYREFEFCGLAGKPRRGGPTPVYDSPEDLMRKTPAYVADKLFGERLDGFFGSAYRYMEALFGAGNNPYLDAIDKHLRYVKLLIERDDFSALRRRPRRRHAPALRRMRKRLGKTLHGPRELRPLAAT